MKIFYAVLMTTSLAVTLASCGAGESASSDTKADESLNSNPHIPFYPPPPAQTTSVVLGTCLLIPAFDAKDIRRLEIGNHGPDQIYFDLGVRELTVTQLTTYNGYGEVTHSEKRHTCANKPRHFEVMSNVGNEAFLAKQIRAYIKSQEAYRCEASLTCF
jgi:hypothetical protein